MTQLDREGIFKARLLEWNVKPSEKSQAVAISIEFHILDQLDGNDWISWERYEDHSVWGDFYVVKSDGQINTGPVEQLAQSIGWNGDFNAVNNDPPDTVVQITVKEDEYDGKIRYRAQWINPGNFTPRPGGSNSGEGHRVEQSVRLVAQSCCRSSKRKQTRSSHRSITNQREAAAAHG